MPAAVAFMIDQVAIYQQLPGRGLEDHHMLSRGSFNWAADPWKACTTPHVIFSMDANIILLGHVHLNAITYAECKMYHPMHMSAEYRKFPQTCIT